MPPAGLRAEDELLLLLLAQRRQGSEARVAALLEQARDWPGLVAQADRHSVVPLLAHRLRERGLGIPAAARLEDLDSAYRRRNLFLAAELRRILAALREEQIPAIPLKGITLAEQLYGRFTLRVSTDIDVLVRRDDVPRAVQALERAGYEAEGPWRRWLDVPYHCEMPLAPRGGPPRPWLDLHWGLLSGDPRHRAAAEECWAEARPATLASLPCWAMSAEWTVLFLVVHAARSQWQGLRLLVDVHQACWTWPLDWDRIQALARRWGWEQALALTLAACRALWDLPPPVPDSDVRWPRWLPRFPAAPRETRWAGLRAALLLAPGGRARAALLLRLAGTSSPNDFRWLPLPAALAPLYLLLRPLRWLVVGGRWCVRAAAQRLGARAGEA